MKAVAPGAAGAEVPNRPRTRPAAGVAPWEGRERAGDGWEDYREGERLVGPAGTHEQIAEHGGTDKHTHIRRGTHTHANTHPTRFK